MGGGGGTSERGRDLQLCFGEKSKGFGDLFDQRLANFRKAKEEQKGKPTKREASNCAADKSTEDSAICSTRDRWARSKKMGGGIEEREKERARGRDTADCASVALSYRVAKTHRML